MTDMILTKIVLNNFRRFVVVEVDFHSGVTGLLGANGSGKTTIADGIGFALYGSQPVLTRTGKDDMKRSDAPDGEGWGVELHFSCNGADYVLVRNTKGAFDKYKRDVKLLRNGSIIAKDDTAVKTLVRDLIGMDFQAFTSSVFCRQAEIAALSNLPPSDRKRLILRMLRISGIDTAIKSLRIDKRSIDNKLKALDELLEGTLDESLNLRKDGEFILKQERVKLEKESANKEKVEAELKEVSDIISGLLMERSEYDKKRKELTDLRVAQERISVLKSDIDSIEKEIKIEKDNIVDFDKGLIDSKSDIEEELSSKKSRKSVAIHTISEYETRVEELNGLGAKCPTCEQDVTPDYAKKLVNDQVMFIKDLQTEEEHLESEIGKLSEKLDKVKAEEDKLRENAKVDSKLQSLEKSLDVKKAELDAKSGTKFDEVEYNRVNDKISSISTDLDDKNRLVKEVQAKLSDANDTVTTIKESIASTESQLHEIERKIREYRENEKKLDEYADKVERYSKTEELMNDFRLFLIGRVRPMLAMFTSQMVSQMTNGRYVKVDIDENYDILMYDHGVSYPISRFSGGEQAVVNLALRLALSQMIAVQMGTEGLGFIVLDEVFGSADTERRETIMETLNGLNNVYSQIICITHIDSVMDMLPNTVRVETDGSTSKVIM